MSTCHYQPITSTCHYQPVTFNLSLSTSYHTIINMSLPLILNINEIRSTITKNTSQSDAQHHQHMILSSMYQHHQHTITRYVSQRCTKPIRLLHFLGQFLLLCFFIEELCGFLPPIWKPCNIHNELYIYRDKLFHP
jgi:hypothetical protein